MIKNVQYNAGFGFTDAEVREMLSYYEFMEKYVTGRVKHAPQMIHLQIQVSVGQFVVYLFLNTVSGD